MRAEAGVRVASGRVIARVRVRGIAGTVVGMLLDLVSLRFASTRKQREVNLSQPAAAQKTNQDFLVPLPLYLRFPKGTARSALGSCWALGLTFTGRSCAHRLVGARLAAIKEAHRARQEEAEAGYRCVDC